MGTSIKPLQATRASLTRCHSGVTGSNYLDLPRCLVTERIGNR